VDSHIARSIRAARKALKLNQAEFAEALGASQGSVSKWESGREVPRVETLQRIAEINPNFSFIDDRLVEDPISAPSTELFMAKVPINGSFVDGITPKYFVDEPTFVTLPLGTLWRDRPLEAYYYTPMNARPPEPKTILLIISGLSNDDRIDDIGPYTNLILRRQEHQGETWYIAQFETTAPIVSGAGALWPISKRGRRRLLPVPVDDNGKIADPTVKAIGVQVCAINYTERLSATQLEPTEHAENE